MGNHHSSTSHKEVHPIFYVFTRLTLNLSFKSFGITIHSSLLVILYQKLLGHLEISIKLMPLINSRKLFNFV